MTDTHVAHRRFVADRLGQLMDEAGLDALVAFSAENTYYLSGEGSFFAYVSNPAGALAVVVRRDRLDRPTAIVTEIEAEQMVSTGSLEVLTYPIWMSIDDPLGVAPIPPITERSNHLGFAAITDQVASVLADIEPSRIGIETGVTSFAAETILRTELGAVADGRQVIEKARSCKSDWEIANIATAVEITEAAIRTSAAEIRPGLTERHLRRTFRNALFADPRTDGVRLIMLSVGTRFSPSFLGGTHKAVPGDLVKFDVGADVNGYGADMARTFSLGPPPAEAQRAWEALRAGHDRLLEIIGPGVRLQDAFEEGMAVIHDNGLTTYTRGHLGHSLGLGRSVEEPPHLGRLGDVVFEPGMVMCVETPYYAYGVGALQCEDILVITDDGTRNLCTLPRELTVIEP